MRRGRIAIARHGRAFLVTASILLAVFAAGLTWRWEFWLFDDPAWQQHAHGWGWISFAVFAVAFHPVIERIERSY